jgi:hypothetical protein
MDSKRGVIMEYTYTEIKDLEDNVIGILRNEDKAVIPLDPANSDYQNYLNPPQVNL